MSKENKHYGRSSIMGKGHIRAIKDLVVKVEFDDDMPSLGEVLIVDNEEKTPLVVEKALSESIVMTLNIRSHRSMQKGMLVESTGKGIEIPVGTKP
jgi:F-type H+-transporting ATPase subunit beta